MPLGRSTGADSVSTRSAGRSRFLCVGTPGHVIAATASASMTGGHHVPSPGPSDAIGSRYSVFPQSAPWPLEQASFSSPKGDKFALDRTRTGDASITRISGPLYLLSYKGIGGPEAEANPRAEGKRSGSAEIRPHTPIFPYIDFSAPTFVGITALYF